MTIRGQSFKAVRSKLYRGDCLKIMPQLEAQSFDACVTDAPYHLASIVKRYGKEGSAPAKSMGKTGVFKRKSAGFMGKSWDGGDIAFRPDTWRRVYRLLKPGAHLVAFGHPKNQHRLASAIEDAGFEIRDSLMWLYGSGFPKSHNVAIEFEKTLCLNAGGSFMYRDTLEPMRREAPFKHPYANEWAGWGTGLKPAHEYITLGRRPMIGTMVKNIEAHHVGGINIDATRADGKWPPNVLSDGILHDRFFYSPKANTDDRAGSEHPTIKPVDLMRWLCRLVTPKGGKILDPFAGSGTTAEAAFYEGFSSSLIEKDPQSQIDIARRMRLAFTGPDERKREITKALGRVNEDAGPLFSGSNHDGRETTGRPASEH